MLPLARKHWLMLALAKQSWDKLFALDQIILTTAEDLFGVENAAFITEYVFNVSLKTS